MSSNHGEQGFSILSSKNNGLKSPISNLKPFNPCVTNAIHNKDQLSYADGRGLPVSNPLSFGKELT